MLDYRAGNITSNNIRPQDISLAHGAYSSTEPFKANAHQLRPATTGPEELELLKESNHPSQSVRFVYEALRTIIQERIPIADWDDNHYTELAILAKSLDNKETKLSALAYQPGSLLNAKQVLISAAIVAYMKSMEVKINSAGDEDEEMGWDNDRAVLVVALGMNMEGHPLFAEANCNYY
ncbi:hypothetical protein BYT27DRAFT_7205649 [Phlegmacium glaucopus]|nr:hypothetical protein BYT27DRAFT_7205649 [Phlegmacium glaucopus]